MQEVAVLNPLLRERITFFSERNINVHNPFKLADLAATLSAGSPDKLQAVLAEKSAEGRLRLALDIISKVTDTEEMEKVAGRAYLLTTFFYFYFCFCFCFCLVFLFLSSFCFVLQVSGVCSQMITRLKRDRWEYLDGKRRRLSLGPSGNVKRSALVVLYVRSELR